MAIRRDKNTGETIEEPTHKIDHAGQKKWKGEADEKQAELRAIQRRAKVLKGDPHAGKASISGDDFSPFEAPTHKVVAEHQRTDDPDRTRLIQSQRWMAERSDKDPMADPVVGWLVVVSGPGKGHARQLGYGRNSLGRSGESRIRLDFGDNSISRDEHATITYDFRGRKFYLQDGGGDKKNLTYLGKNPVLVPTVLEAMQEFSVGNTTLRFVPFCGPEFEWDDT